MPLPSFSNGAVLTAAQLNAMITYLNTIEQVTDIPVPLFQQAILDNDEFLGSSRVWRYLIMHRSVNRYLRYQYQWVGPESSPSVKFFVANNPTAYGLSTAEGITTGHIDLQPLSIPAGALYMVRVEVDRGTSTAFRLRWMFEMSYV